MNTETKDSMRRFGLIGRNISYSFSRGYFTKKFSREKIDAIYENFDLQDISEFPDVLKTNPQPVGFNVTIPYKEAIIPYLDSMDPIAAEIGAVNTIKVNQDGTLTGYNTDLWGFIEAIGPHLKPAHTKALILGTGGASKAVNHGLKSLGLQPAFVSRTASRNTISYEDLSEEILQEYTVVVNTTPLGTSPKTEEYPDIPIQFLTPQHLVFDLIYNPPTTKLMELALLQGATVVNGQKMLEFQAEKAWEIWNKSSS